MPMRLHGSAGYAMAALLVALGVMSVAATIAMPVWHQAARREKEAELIFRGEQYVRAISLFQRRTGPGALPPDVEFLVENRFLRKAYRDPMTGEAFQVVRQDAAPGPARAGAPPGMIGVVSTSAERSIRLYGDRNTYNEWLFVQRNTTSRPDDPGTTGPENPARGGAAPEGTGGSDRRQ
jgi:type II secretory pathway pseudopilin PulG